MAYDARGTGDHGAALDLAVLAEIVLGPTVDWQELADAMVGLTGATNVHQRAMLLDHGTRAANGDVCALSMLRRRERARVTSGE